MRLTTLAAAAAAFGLSLAASQAGATQFTGSWNLQYNSTDPGLVIAIDPINQNFDFALSPGNELKVLPLFTIYTNEATVNWLATRRDPNGNDDVQAKPIELTFSFLAPTPNTVDPITGVTNGQVALFGAFQNGILNWSGSGLGGTTALNFGVGDPKGLLTIGVNGGTFNSGIAALRPGLNYGLTVYGTFDWDRDALPLAGGVPEPATWAMMIGGFGMAGATLRRRRRLAV